MSDKLRHFPSSDPPKAGENSLRDEIQAQIDEYLANGGTITQVHYTDNYTYKQPIYPTRAEQTAIQKRWKFTSTKKPLRDG